MREIVGTAKTKFRSDLDARINDYLQRKFIAKGLFAGGVTLVARDGEVATVASAGESVLGSGTPMTDDKIFRIYSMTKPITSIALMMLFEEGRVLLEDPIGKFLPEFGHMKVRTSGNFPNYVTRYANQSITVKHLLSHTSGLTYDFLVNSNIDYGYRKLGLSGFRPDCSLEEFSKKVASLPLEFEPGTKWNYSVATDICGRLIEVISGQSLREFFIERIFKPLQMHDTDFYVPAEKLDRLTACYENLGTLPASLQDNPEASTYATMPKAFMGGSGLVSTVWDYYRFAQMVANGGELDGTRIIGPRTVDLMASNHLPGNVDLNEFGVPGIFSESPFLGVGFGLGFSTVLTPAANNMNGLEDEFSWGGAASTSFWISPHDGIVVVFMTQLMPSASTSVRRGLHAVIHGASEI